MVKSNPKYNSHTVFSIGYVNIGATVFFLVYYLARRLVLGLPPDQGFIVAIVTLALLSLATIVIARCLKGIELRLSSEQQTTKQEN